MGKPDGPGKAWLWLWKVIGGETAPQWIGVWWLTRTGSIMITKPAGGRIGEARLAGMPLPGWSGSDVLSVQEGSKINNRAGPLRPAQAVAIDAAAGCPETRPLHSDLSRPFKHNTYFVGNADTRSLQWLLLGHGWV